VDSGPWDDYYGLLGIDAHADEVQLRRAWRRLALRWHPDRAGPAATKIFQKILAAYLVLSDPLERAAYDRRRGIVPAASGRRAPGVLLQRLSGPLSTLLACGVARRADDGVIELVLDAGEVVQGGMATISMNVEVRCGACAASGRTTCDRCGGRGTVGELFSAWLAVRPEVADGTVLKPSVQLRGSVRPVLFRARHHATR
jgi:molecular chaperone DnaJ